jgi:NOL1/NOP2/sun family putative RNA methylase
MPDVLARYEPLVDDPEAFRAACGRPLPTCVRVNDLKAGRRDEPLADAVARVREAFAVGGVEATPVEWHPLVLRVDTDGVGSTWPDVHGWVHGQEEISALPPVVLDPRPGERVWDAAAAPGSKATQIAALMDDGGTLVANDTNMGRLAPLRSNTERLGITNTVVTHQDARNFSLTPLAFDAFDRALVDAPCSCEGTVRKNPDAVEDWSETHVEHVAGLQKGILRRAVQATVEGGVVVYATCTFAPEENEAVLDHVLAEEACRVVEYDVGLETRPGITEWDGETYDEQVTKAKRVYPHLNDTGGFFCAKLEVAA